MTVFAVDFSYAGTDFSLVDTAGIRRRKLDDGIEKISVLKALESALMSDVVVLVCDAEQSIESQDATLAARALAAGCALVVAVNKQDLINTDNRSILERSIDLKLRFLTSVSVCLCPPSMGRVSSSYSEPLNRHRNRHVSNLPLLNALVCCKVRLLSMNCHWLRVKGLNCDMRIKAALAHRGLLFMAVELKKYHPPIGVTWRIFSASA